VHQPTERSPCHTFFFAKDVDGNSIELIDPGRMYHVLGLGPLGGSLPPRHVASYDRLLPRADACHTARTH
jgi:hypothetical protein